MENLNLWPGGEKPIITKSTAAFARPELNMLLYSSREPAFLSGICHPHYGKIREVRSKIK